MSISVDIDTFPTAVKCKVFNPKGAISSESLSGNPDASVGRTTCGLFFRLFP